MRGIAGLLAVVLAIAVLVVLVTTGWRAVVSPHMALRELLSHVDDPANSADSSRRTFVVRLGESAEEIARRLESAGLIPDATLFRIRVRLEGAESDLAAGEYELSPSMRPSEILAILVQGRTKQSPLVTIPEGWRAEEIADRLAARGVGTAEEFMRVVRDGQSSSPALASRPAGASLEGYLFPETYAIDAKSTPESMAQRMVEQFEAQFTTEMREKASRLGMSVHQIVILASVIEREAVVPSERPLMAGVFYNRLNAGMLLQADPTVQYALTVSDPEAQRKHGWWKKGLTAEDLEIDSPYNSYRYPGLPPGPICNPGLASLRAAVEPATTDYVYFVAKPDGSHAFAKTLDEHNANVARYRP